MARIYKQNNKWCFSINTKENGKRKRIVRGGFLREKDAKKAAREFENNLDKGIVPTVTNITLHDFMWNNWLEYKKDYVKLATHDNIKTCLKRVDKILGTKLKLKDVTPVICTNLTIALLNDLKLSRSSAKTTLIYLKMVFKYAVLVEKILSYNPAEFVYLPKYTRQEKEKMILNYENEKQLYMEKDVLKKFLDATKSNKNSFPFYAIAMTLAYTGMRIGEVLALQWENIDLKNKIIYVKHDVFFKAGNFILQTPKTKTSIREIIIPDILVSELKIYRKQFLEYKIAHSAIWENNGCDFVFNSIRTPGKPFKIRTISQWIKNIAIEINEPYIHAHTFRHTHVSLLAEMGCSLPAIKERLGHSDDKITENIYLHITKKHKEELANKLDSIAL